MSDQAESAAEKILIVDDKTANLDLLREMLAPLGYQIYFATSGAKAIDIAATVHPDLVLLDVMMPDMDGFGTCRRFKGDEALEEIPVIFVTARTDVEDLARGFEAGAVDYVTKPVKQPEVRARVATHLRILRLIQEQRRHLKQIEQARRELQELNDAKDKFMSNIAVPTHEHISCGRYALHRRITRPSSCGKRNRGPSSRRADRQNECPLDVRQ